MSDNANYNMGDTEAPDNQEKVFLTPGYHKLTVKSFEYKKEDAGKTPLITMVATKVDKETGDDIEFKEKFYVSGKLNKDGKMSSVIRLQELAVGLTGNKITANPSLYAYTKSEANGTSESFTIPNPEELTAYLNKNCVGKTAIFKIGGEESDGKVYTKLTFSGFLYYTDRQKNLCRYKEERDFDEYERGRSVQKKKEAAAPAGGGSLTTTKFEEM
jgi:hypothetical protein